MTVAARPVVARMWESRIAEEQLAAFWTHLATQTWPALAATPGFAGGEAYRADDAEHRAVVVTRWYAAAAARAAAALEEPLAAFCAREPHAWQFACVDLGTDRGGADRP